MNNEPTLPGNRKRCLAMIIRLAGFSVNTMVDPAGTGRGPRHDIVWLRPLDRRHRRPA